MQSNPAPKPRPPPTAQLAIGAKDTHVNSWTFLNGAYWTPDTKNFDLFKEAGVILDAHTPPTPPFAHKAATMTMGSCFAERLRTALKERHGMDATQWLGVPSGLNNVFAIRGFLSWLYTNTTAETDYWYERDEDGQIRKWMGDRAKIRLMFDKVEVLVFTLGLAEVWRDKETGHVFWRGVPGKIYKRRRHECVMSTVAETTEAIRDIIEMVHKYAPGVKLVFTLSPVPLAATPNGKSVVVSDCISKSILRAAIHEALWDAPPDVYYWPSFEIVKWLGAHVERTTFGGDGKVRHPAPDVIAWIVDQFIERFYQ